MRWLLVVIQITILLGIAFTLGMMVAQPTPLTSSLATQRVGELVKPTAFHETVTITWISEPWVVDEKLKTYEDRTGTKAKALAYPLGQNCTIYSREPEYSTDSWMTTLGHEALHCFRGHWHD